VTDLASKVKEQSFGSQAQVFTIPEQDGQLEIEIIDSADKW
jgi:hypothetical protein